MAKTTPKPPATRGRRPKGDGALYRRNDGIWVGVVNLGFGGDGKRKRKTVSSTSQAVALKKLRELQATIDTHGSAPRANMSVATWLEQWLDSIARQRVRPKTLEGYRTCVRQHIVPSLGARRLDQLAAHHVREMQTHLRSATAERSPLAETTILKAHRVLAKALTDAVREGVIHRNVATLVDAPKKNASTRTGLDAGQAIRLLVANAEEPMASRWFAALFTGARQGELLGLEWERVADALDLSWQLQRINYRHGCVQLKDGAWPCGRKTGGGCPDRALDVPRHFEHHIVKDNLVLSRPKSAAGTRIVAIAEPLREVLDRHRANMGNPARGLVWTTSEGDPINPREDLRAWHAALERAGLPSVPLHSARHSTATLLMDVGVDAHVISTMLGHSNVAVTRGYQHVDLTLQRQALSSLSGLLALPHGEQSQLAAGE